jgi:hypothetical protein
MVTQLSTGPSLLIHKHRTDQLIPFSSLLQPPTSTPYLLDNKHHAPRSLDNSDPLQTITLTMAEPASDRMHIQRALIMLNLQRAQVFDTTIEGGNDASDEAVRLWVDAAIDAVNTRQSVRTLQPTKPRPTLT